MKKKKKSPVQCLKNKKEKYIFLCFVNLKYQEILFPLLYYGQFKFISLLHVTILFYLYNKLKLLSFLFFKQTSMGVLGGLFFSLFFFPSALVIRKQGKPFFT